MEVSNNPSEGRRLKCGPLGSRDPICASNSSELTRLNSAHFGGFFEDWSGRVDLNHRPLGPEPSPEGLGSLRIDAISGRG